MTKLLEPVEVKREIQETLDAMSEGWRYVIQFANYRSSVRDHVLSRGEDWAQRTRNEIKAYDAELPTVGKTERWEKAIRAVLETPASEKERRLLVGMCLDGFRAKPTDGSPVLVEAIVYSLAEGVEMPDGSLVPVSATVLADAVRQAWRTCVFPPGIKELLELCRERRDKFKVASSCARQLRAARVEIDAILADPELMPPEKLPDDPDAIPF
jgi:hypothetical protein